MYTILCIPHYVCPTIYDDSITSDLKNYKLIKLSLLWDGGIIVIISAKDAPFISSLLQPSSLTNYTRQRPRRSSSTPISSPSKKMNQATANLHSSVRLAADQLPEGSLLGVQNQENMSSDSSLFSPKLSKIVADSSESVSPLVSPKPITSSLKKSSSKKKSARGLSVSFVQSHADKDIPNTKGSVKHMVSKKKIARHSTQRDLGSTLVDSLNASKFGAMERQYAQTRKEGKFSRRFPGGDPRLGYDWIAGLLDSSESYLSERGDEYFEEMKEFRRVNYEECHQAEAL